MGPSLRDQVSLQTWYNKLQPHIVDLVGDIAGREPFLIHGESLIRYCLEQSRVDFEDGFQVLHAVYAVERFLGNLQRRGCDFDIIFFHSLRSLCVPSGSTKPYKHQYARAVILRHLTRYARECAKNGARAAVLEFPSPECQEFVDYLLGLPAHFVLCHDGDEEVLKDTIQLRHLMYKLVSMGRNVAILNSVRWKSSKVFAPLLSRSSITLPLLKIEEEFDSPFGEDGELGQLAASPSANISAREYLGILACQSILHQKMGQNTSIDEEFLESIQAFLLHLAILKHCTLLDRQQWVTPRPCLEHSCHETLQQLIETSVYLLENDFVEAMASSDDLEWDLYDPIDGFLYISAVRVLRNKQVLPPEVLESWRFLWSFFLQGIKVNFQDELPLLDNIRESITTNPPSMARTSALPFSHPVLDEYLGSIKLDEMQESENAITHKVFQDLHHWHSTKLLLPPKKPEKASFSARKKNQKRLADIVAYSASLTNANGKLINPEIVVVKRGSPSSKKKPTSEGVEVKEATTKRSKRDSAGQKLSGKEMALKAAQEIRDRKASAKRDNVAAFWRVRSQEIEKDPNLVSRYLKATRFLMDRSDTDILSLGSEIYLYLCYVLGLLWAKSHRTTAQEPREGLYLIALIWRWLQKISASGASKGVIGAVKEMTSSLNMPALTIPITSDMRDLCFGFSFDSLRDLGERPDYRVLQLEHGGPYMERRFDSKPDPRVPFEPDAWQRKVLDSIDANNSLLVIAPTSAGKTFISFYAMKRVMEQSDDGILVYVAPTKALVNQIAAEVGARFTKSFSRQEGKSVWAIHTRDYRIQSPTGCQVLVTVPHILQIMLLAPTNAKGQNAWSRRIKRIIFDEVHCIGQEEDGVVWEQLLLSAPCPIIALSATVGNPGAFHDWLSLAQERKGRKLDMVVHSARYSDLRKFIHAPREWRKFDGFQTSHKIPVPGLDEGDGYCENFQFVHPVAALADRNRTALSDLSLEARDCLSLWRCMKKVLSKEEITRFGIPEPSASLPDSMAKSDVLQWEAGLKRALQHIMETQASTFQQIRKMLGPVIDETSVPDIDNSHLSMGKQVESLFQLAWDLQRQNALPVLVFHYDTFGCERLVEGLFRKLDSAEEDWKKGPQWVRKIKEFENWKMAQKAQKKKKAVHQSKHKDDPDSMSKFEQMQEDGNAETSSWETFDPEAPLGRFSFADLTKLPASEVDAFIKPLKGRVKPMLLDALNRGLGVHHSGMNIQYRQAVEIMFRKGYLTLVVATGTLALGINMPCKTVVFQGDSIFLTAQNYRQASGRAGRRGFDLLGNVVFNMIPKDRVYEIMSARLPGLNGQFPISTTLILRLLTLLHGSDNCDFAVDMVQSILSQNRLYLGGPESEMSVRHHIRFSIEYLRRQRLVSANGVPINFSGLVGHLYFTENAVFAFHSLLKGGYFHQLCSRFPKNREGVLLEMMLVLCHLFDRQPIRRTPQRVEVAHKSSSIVFLPRLPSHAEELLIQHNQETLSIFKGYVQSYVDLNLTGKRDCTLPFTKTQVGQETPLPSMHSKQEASKMVRSPFVALSGYTDDFGSIHELCETVRGDVFLEESAIPYIPIWPNDTNIELNAYLYDFFKHGSMHVLTRDNGIKRSAVWFLLQDFSRTLSTIITSLSLLIGADENGNGEGHPSSEDEEQSFIEDEKPVAVGKAPGKAETKTADTWDDDGNVNGVDLAESSFLEVGSPEGSDDGDDAVPSWEDNGQGMNRILAAFSCLRYEFNEKFSKEWA